ncbi:MAG TPA: DUF1839 family protein [Pirellulales bacterium]|jgi:hypothetical protein|nr:DUF1839 family protein [Pirellulales bacterium]
MSTSLFAITPEQYARHPLHTQERDWAETNCYVDIWIELLHALGHEPLAALPFTVGIDFEGDQFTFFKFPHADLRDLFGLDVQELAVWRPLAAHLHDQIALGRPVLVELDSYYLPDTAGTAYQREHVKSTVAAVEIDLERQQLGYFHGQGYYQLNGSDFTHVLRVGSTDSSYLPPYVEVVKPSVKWRPSDEQLLATSWSLLVQHAQRLPEENPFSKFKLQFAADLDWLLRSPIDVFHQYSFATLRQFGSCYELTANYFRWLQSQHIGDLEGLIAAFSRLSSSAKTMQFQLARAMARKKTVDLSAIDEMAATWNLATELLLVRTETSLEELAS